MDVRAVRTNRIKPKLKFTIQISRSGCRRATETIEDLSCIRQRVDEEHKIVIEQWTSFLPRLLIRSRWEKYISISFFFSVQSSLIKIQLNDGDTKAVDIFVSLFYFGPEAGERKKKKAEKTYLKLLMKNSANLNLRSDRIGQDWQAPIFSRKTSSRQMHT